MILNKAKFLQDSECKIISVLQCAVCTVNTQSDPRSDQISPPWARGRRSRSAISFSRFRNTPVGTGKTFMRTYAHAVKKKHPFFLWKALFPTRVDGSWGRGKLLFTRKEAETSAPVYFLPPLSAVALCKGGNHPCWEQNLSDIINFEFLTGNNSLPAVP